MRLDTQLGYSWQSVALVKKIMTIFSTNFLFFITGTVYFRRSDVLWQRINFNTCTKKPKTNPLLIRYVIGFFLELAYFCTLLIQGGSDPLTLSYTFPGGRSRVKLVQ